MKIFVGARSSNLSKKQVEEVQKELFLHHPEIELVPVWASSPGDRDRTTSLRLVEMSDFFTKDLDQMLLEKKIDATIHSAKDLPDPLRQEFVIAALTEGLDPRDSIVFLQELKKGAKIALSSARREEIVRKIDPTFQLVDLRGTIEERLSLLEKKEVDGVVVAEAALIRLGLTSLNRRILPEKGHPLQGRLAIVIRKEDHHLQTIFRSLHAEDFVFRT